MTTEETLRRLESIKNHGTLYELAVEKNGHRYLVAYSRQGQRALRECIGKRAEAFTRLTDAESYTLGKRAADGATTDTGWRVWFTGRTERDAICNGPLEYIGKIA